MESPLGLWKTYAATRDPELRERLIMQYVGLVRYIVGRMPQASLPGVDSDDLVGYGILGLIDAVERYDIDRGVKFETYAMTRIRGAIIDHLRSMDWVPRSVRQKARDIERAINAAEFKLGRQVRDEDVAAELHLDIETYHEWISEISKASYLSLDELICVDEDNNFATMMDFVRDSASPDPEMVFEVSELRDVLARAIDALPEREKLVITLYYYDELTIREIASILGVSESRVSQLHTKGMLRLRVKIQQLKERMAV
ncbi:MAG: FliA/WhiG family RNA polymerase sigma factor [Firmicutes bacterium]|jgi:RNA polymerase sigma factor for flagellar operon FliA|nr:FliA/WhiG family RNA polymerase sigma factor [Bacillota bacterium]